MKELLEIALYAVVLAPVLAAAAYLVIRAGSIAYFRTKLVYLRTMMKELKGGSGG